MAEKRERYSIIDFIKNITINKVPWTEYSEVNQKDFSGFMIQKWMSMNYDLIEFINSLQKYLPLLDKEYFYKLYFNILPKENIYIKYVKGNKSEKLNPELISYLSKYFEIGNDQAEEYAVLFLSSKNGTEELKSIIQKYGKTDKEIKKIITVK